MVNKLIEHLLNKHILYPNQITKASDAAQLTKYSRMQNTWDEINQAICDSASRGLNFCYYVIKQHDNLKDIQKYLTDFGYTVNVDNNYHCYYLNDTPMTRIIIIWEV